MTTRREIFGWKFNPDAAIRLGRIGIDPVLNAFDEHPKDLPASGVLVEARLAAPRRPLLSAVVRLYSGGSPRVESQDMERNQSNTLRANLKMEPHIKCSVNSLSTGVKLEGPHAAMACAVNGVRATRDVMGEPDASGAYSVARIVTVDESRELFDAMGQVLGLEPPGLDRLNEIVGSMAVDLGSMRR